MDGLDVDDVLPLYSKYKQDTDSYDRSNSR
jgi:hypothetical protein